MAAQSCTSKLSILKCGDDAFRESYGVLQWLWSTSMPLEARLRLPLYLATVCRVFYV